MVLVIGAAVRQRRVARRARRTLLEERARTARALYDVVAHHMSVITVQADSPPCRLPELSVEAREESGTIAAGARESPAELRRLLAVPRGDGAEGERAPQPGIDRPQLPVGRRYGWGLPAEPSPTTGLGDVPPAVDLARVPDRSGASANVVRRAPGARTRVSVTAGGGLLTVLVVNGPPKEPVSPLEPVGTGHGPVGTRQRVRLTGGSLGAGPLPDGGCWVAARLPPSPAGPDDAPLSPEEPCPSV
ncbi:hypothetical protein FKN01_01285 [Streptomyces sp. 130]|nr:hypothetical protein FKN01_01285 [Streptomyces sp. 130]